METTEFKTTWGLITVTLAGDKVIECTLPFLKNPPHKPFLIEGFHCVGNNGVAAQCAATQLQSVFQGLDLRYSKSIFGISPNKRPAGEWKKSATSAAVSPKVGTPEGTEFQKRVWNEIKKIPRGQTRTYGEIAATLGRPKAVRAVGSACGANPVPLFIPCHRVVAKNGLGGFGPGLPWKKLLLRMEGWNGGIME